MGSRLQVGRKVLACQAGLAQGRLFHLLGEAVVESKQVLGVIYWFFGQSPGWSNLFRFVHFKICHVLSRIDLFVIC
jgi:hypothetical protein